MIKMQFLGVSPKNKKRRRKKKNQESQNSQKTSFTVLRLSSFGSMRKKERKDLGATETFLPFPPSAFFRTWGKGGKLFT